MWLISTFSLKLEFVADPETHRYAILSHTWRGQEVTFQEMNASDGPDKTKKGWKKIEETCRLARDQHGLEYAWVDTCCIDKSSSAELSEAINTMFSWYKQSAICFVFLEDVEFPHVRGAPVLRRGTPEFQDRLGLARWFSRGWTLQELVASRHVVFYDATGTELGDKASLVDDLVHITKIDRAVLQDVDRLHMVPVARKMSWAAHRETTRVEDMAYCLLGMFDVNMPLLYGEGPRAFLRLEQEIARSGSDLSLFAWSPPPGTPYPVGEICGIFAPSPAEFWNGHKRRLPGWALERSLDVSVADHGFLRINRNIYLSEDGMARLMLDCLVPDSESPSGTAWLEVELQKVGSFYARILYARSSSEFGDDEPGLAKTRSRLRRSPGQAVRPVWPTGSLSVATAIPVALANAYRTRPHPSELLYTQGLFHYMEATQGIKYCVPFTVPLEALQPTTILIAAPKGKSNDFLVVGESLTEFAKSYDNTFFPAVDGVFSAVGIRGSRHHHLFEFNSVPVALVWCQELTMTEGKMSPTPWAILLCPESCQAAPEGSPIHRPEVFRSSSLAGSMSEEERSGILHDYVFQWYSDDAGGYRTDNMATTLRLPGQVGDSRVVFELQVHAALGLTTYDHTFYEPNPSVTLVLSHRQLPTDSEAW